MRLDTDSLACAGLPVFVEQAEEVRDWVASLTYEEQKALWKCSDKIAAENHARFANMELRRDLTPALLAYEGIQYAYMAPAVFEDGEFDYVQEHVRILSGLYGVLRPMDGVVSYRLEMQAKACVAGAANLYDYWGRKLYDEVRGQDCVIVNLASKEYSKAIERYLAPEDTCVTCVFAEVAGNRLVQKGVYVKMARGEMVRYMASTHAERPEDLKGFAWSGYAYDEGNSTSVRYVFSRQSGAKSD